jgi:molecular chaperone GrpE (heat shock protein)
MNEVMLELASIKEHNKQLQSQFNDIQLAYAKEVEKSQNWEKLHRELSDKYNSLEKDHDSLKVLYEKLKADFDKYKKTTR